MVINVLSNDQMCTKGCSSRSLLYKTVSHDGALKQGGEAAFKLQGKSFRQVSDTKARLGVRVLKDERGI